jgi:hypothetical protein
MAITLIRKGKDNLMLETAMVEFNGEEILTCVAKSVNDKLEAEAEDPGIRYQLDYTEEEFHRKLREDAAKKGHLITSHSTDPEWNPEGYTKNLEK